MTNSFDSRAARPGGHPLARMALCALLLAQFGQPAPAAGHTPADQARFKQYLREKVFGTEPAAGAQAPGNEGRGETAQHSVREPATGQDESAGKAACALFDPRQHYAYAFTADPQWVRGLLADYRDLLCVIIEARPAPGKTLSLPRELDSKLERIALATDTFNALVSFFGYCAGPVLKPAFVEHLQRKEMPESSHLVYREFCHRADAAVRSVNAGESHLLRTMSEQQRWFHAEVFCEASRFVAHPGGWRGLLVDGDYPALNRLKDTSDELCRSLRDGVLTYRDVDYRWRQEMMWVRQRLGTEVAKDGVTYLLDVISGLLK